MNLIQRIDALLPQTQCGKCGHPGCKPYAEGIARGEAINKCPPGGQETIAGLALLLRVPVLDLDTHRGEAPAQVAYIREAECIGCTKCIQACPVDAIVGAAKLMHTVIIDECTGCDLCVAPCPVDCIEMHPATRVLPIVGGLATNDREHHERGLKRDRARRRFEQRNARLQREEAHKLAERLARAKRSAPTQPVPADAAQAAQEAAVKQAKITLAMSRAQLHKSLKAFGHPPTFEQQSQLIVLQQQFEAAEQALAALEVITPTTLPPPKDPALKRAKIQLAMRRAELKKAQDQNADEQQLALLSAALSSAEQALHDAEADSQQPRPDLQRVEKRPIDAQLRQLKTALAYARAEVSKLQRQAGVNADQLKAAQHRLEETQRQVDAYVDA
ncbi:MULTISPECIES: electron transport complex subunit RsxB [Pseudomonas fluorescens group]|uniref:Ion-translocating oxidoreductase complex subunit B n=2 Tax=Pseudomonas fluorescens TaxID=294 RepID=C3KBZ6_PSEFS|nr:MULTISPECIES: electron transport complex subunit RsxB [Pseudomonas fluorescens group]MBZ6456136.1 electron transport complex subunit RsxB [Pseudomonas fluorescens group sp.]PLR61117.1 electron transport complex subunit RsxB [Pseudomonas sp. QC2]SFU55800.1 electron transport complex protein RnfB [Pseudomonas sp. OV546]KJZ57436.1 electron transporter RnfB [Pseudomonas marginalis]KJZ61175.1 electron transporter RnfB [Pseudomonas marginalis]